ATGGGSGDDFTVSGTTATDGTARNLTVVAGSGNTALTGAVGAGANNLGVLTVSSETRTTSCRARRATDISLASGTDRLTDNVTAMRDEVAVSGSLALVGTVQVNTGGGSGDDFTVSGTTAGDVAGRNLTVVAGTGNTTLSGAAGTAPNNLGVLTVSS